MAGQRGARGELRAHRVQLEAARGPQQVQHDGACGRRRGCGGQQRALEPIRPQWLPGGDHPGVQPGGADQRERHDPGERHDRVGDECPGQQRADGGRHVPAARRAIQDQPGQQDRHATAQVVRRQQEQEDARPELRGAHDPGGDGHPDRGGPAGAASPGQCHGQQRHDGEGDRGGGVHHVRAAPEHQFHQHVLGQFGVVEGHVGQPPAVQQQVAVQHVPGLQGEHRAVGVPGVGLRHPQVAGEHRGRGGRPGRHREPAAPRAPGGRAGRARLRGRTWAGLRRAAPAGQNLPHSPPPQLASPAERTGSPGPAWALARPEK